VDSETISRNKSRDLLNGEELRKLGIRLLDIDVKAKLLSNSKRGDLAESLKKVNIMIPKRTNYRKLCISNRWKVSNSNLRS
jgi:hypothetical protein